MTKEDREGYCERISIIVPVFNERENIPLLSGEVEKIMISLNLDYELIFIDDGSIDGSEGEVARLHQKNPRNKLNSLSRNFGHQAALSAGLEFAGGDAVIMMDGDMQHPPEVIPELIKRWKEGFDIVYTIREDTGDAGFFKKYSSVVFYWLINQMTRTPIPVGAADFRLLNRAVVKELRKFREQSRFLRGLVSWTGFRQTGISYVAPPRSGGTSGYSLRKMICFAMDGITSFSSFPLRIATYMGLFVSGISFVYGLYTVFIAFFSDKVISGWASLMVMVLFLGGVQLITLGIMGEYLGRIYDQVKERPLYVVQKKLGDFRE